MNSKDTHDQTISHVLNFWFDELTPEQWWRSAELDDEIRQRFQGVYEVLSKTVPVAWLETPKGALAAIIVLDQFPRNIFRNTARSFATDEIALEISKKAIKQEWDRQLNENEKMFLYMPLQHSEDPEDQVQSVRLFKELGIESSYEFAKQHKEIIDRFGRFPHRNEVLGRTSTEEERAFLAEGALFW